MIVIAGDITHQAVLEEQIALLFADLPATKTLTQPSFVQHLPAQHSGWYDKKTQQNHLVISAP